MMRLQGSRAISSDQILAVIHRAFVMSMGRTGWTFSFRLTFALHVGTFVQDGVSCQTIYDSIFVAFHIHMYIYTDLYKYILIFKLIYICTYLYLIIYSFVNSHIYI